MTEVRREAYSHLAIESLRKRVYFLTRLVQFSIADRSLVSRSLFVLVRRLVHISRDKCHQRSFGNRVENLWTFHFVSGNR